MKEIFEGYWWLLFPLGGFIVLLLSSFMSYMRRKAELDVLKSYVQQGKDPPPELSKALGGGGPDPIAGDPWDAYAHPYYGKAWKRYYRYGPYGEWRRAITMGAISLGFYLAYRYSDVGAGHAFLIVSIITGVIAAASLVFALLQGLFPPPK